MRNDGRRVWHDDGRIVIRNTAGIGVTICDQTDAVELLTELSQIVAGGSGVFTFDCYHRALPGEPRFTLLGRDPEFAKLLKQWADKREYDIACGDRPSSDRDRVLSARKLAAIAPEWRRDHNGAWRVPSCA